MFSINGLNDVRGSYKVDTIGMVGLSQLSDPDVSSKTSRLSLFIELDIIVHHRSSPNPEWISTNYGSCHDYYGEQYRNNISELCVTRSI